MSSINRPTLNEALARLNNHDDFPVVVQFLREERERFFGDLRQSIDANEVMKIAGSISTLTEMIDLFSLTEAIA